MRRVALAALATASAAAASPTAATLNDGLQFPKVSFGLQVYDDATAQQYTSLALKAGVTNFFASVLAGNQKGFGAALAASDVPRDNLFVCGSANTASCSGSDDCYQQTVAACHTNLADLGAAGGLEGFLDMIMLDYPAGDCDSIRGQWRAFEEMLANKTTKSIAVSNFSPQQLACLPANGTTPAVNQLPYSVGHGADTSVADNAKAGGIIVQAYSPLGSGGVLSDPDCVSIGKAHNKSSAQVALRWILQRNATFTTSSSSLAHFQDDLAIFDFKLSAQEMATLNAKSLFQKL